jgi:hypothetical protein
MIQNLIEEGWCILDAPGNDTASIRWKNQTVDFLTELLGPDHVYVTYLRDSFDETGKVSILSGTGILDAVGKELVGTRQAFEWNSSLNGCDTTGRTIMRIDYGPDFDEIRDSIQNGTVVTFGSSSGETVRCVVLDAKMDHTSGRAALMLEEQSTSNVYFARYTHTGGRWSCGDLVTWRLKLHEIEELRRDVA